MSIEIAAERLTTIDIRAIDPVYLTDIIVLLGNAPEGQLDTDAHMFHERQADTANHTFHEGYHSRPVKNLGKLYKVKLQHKTTCPFQDNNNSEKRNLSFTKTIAYN